MKSFLVLSAVVFMAACNSTPSGQTEMAKTLDSSGVSQTIKSPYAIMYSSKFVIDSPRNAESLLTLWKDWDNGDLSAHKNLFADSIQFHFSDGTNIHLSRDSAVAIAQNQRNSYAASVDRVDAIMAVRSTDKNDHWALIWGTEIDTDKKGKVDSANLMEAWRFNKDGKVDLLTQYRQGAYPPKK
jgi:hypothetical protein